MSEEQKLFLDAKRTGYLLVIVKDTETYWLGEWIGDRYTMIWLRGEDGKDKRELTASEVRQIISRRAGYFGSKH